MSDPRKPPPRFPRLPPRDEPEVTRVEEDPVPNTERLPQIHPPPRVPTEPFRLLSGRPPSYVEFQAQLGDFSQKLEAVISSEAAVLGVQRKMAIQIDGLGQTVNQRFDLFHEELALLRATVVGDHAPRLEAAEKTLGQKAAKGGGILAIVVIALPMLAEALPKYAHVFETILGVLQ
ncbi:MAG TPA: hypothetical protein VGK73_05740 [Polyangiaceae bacterium]